MDPDGWSDRLRVLLGKARDVVVLEDGLALGQPESTAEEGRRLRGPPLCFVGHVGRQ